MLRPHAIEVNLGLLGAGETDIVSPPEAILQHEGDQPPQAFMAPADNVDARNAWLFRGQVRPRLGYKVAKTLPNTKAVTHVFLAQFGDNVQEAMRFDTAGAYYDNAGTWTSLSAAGAGGFWTAAMVRRAGGTTRNNQVLFAGNGDSDVVWKYTGGGAAVASVVTGTLKGPRLILGHEGRALYCNVYDVGAGARQLVRVWRSIVGDPLTMTGTGSGFTDLDDDPYPIVGGHIISNNIVLAKSSQLGGSFVVGTLTGVATNPYRWDTINTNSVGVLLPRTFIMIAPDITFFVGHDGFYLYDGGRTPLPIAQKASAKIVQRVNPNALLGGVAWYDPASQEIKIGIPTAGASYPTEYWVYNVRERRVFGPYQYADPPISASATGSSGSLFINDLVGTIDSLVGTIDSLGGVATARTTLLGGQSGYTYEDDGLQVTDAGNSISATLSLPPVTPRGRLSADRQVQYKSDDRLVLKEITLIGTNDGAWTPTVQLSTDGSTFNVVSDGSTMGGTLYAGRNIDKRYDVNVGGSWFQLKISGQEPMRLRAVRLEFVHGGSERNT